MSDLLEKEKQKQAIKPPTLHNVVFLNDDFTSFEFVVDCLVSIFGKTEEQATMLAKSIHNSGKAVVGTYTKDIAITKQSKTMDIAQRREFPLQVIVEAA